MYSINAQGRVIDNTGRLVAVKRPASYTFAAKQYTRAVKAYGKNSTQAKRLYGVLWRRAYVALFPQFA